jgi:hypothetical protein
MINQPSQEADMYIVDNLSDSTSSLASDRHTRDMWQLMICPWVVRQDHNGNLIKALALKGSISQCEQGAGEDAELAAHRQWFEDHSFAQSYPRPVLPCEIVEAAIAGTLVAGAWVAVRREGPGARIRYFSQASGSLS